MSWVWHNKKTNHSEPDWNAPVPDATAARLEYLYAWERRCRGYTIHPYPVPLEPPYLPYGPEAPDSYARLAQAQALPQTASPSFRHLSLELPLDQKVTPTTTAGFLSSFQGLRYPLAFEIVADSIQIAYQLTPSAGDAQTVESSARMHWPKARIEVVPDLFHAAIHNSRLVQDGTAYGSFVVDFGLLHFAYLPLAVFENFAVDPLAGVLAGLGQVGEGEVAGLQVLFAPTNSGWNRSLMAVAAEFEDDAFRPDSSRSSFGRSAFESESVRVARAKLEHPLYACALRVFALSRSGDNRAFHLCKTIGSALGVFNAPGSGSVGTASGAQSAGNGLIALSNNDPQATHPHSLYPDRLHFHDVLERTTHRAGMLLSLPELAGLVHPPAESVQHPRLVRFDPRERSLPDHLLEAEGALLGIHRFRSQEQPLVWPDAYRNRHAYILGATRMGKSTLLLNMIVQDMSAGRGLCLIDPHGDLALDILHRVPPERAGDVIYLDLSDREYPLALGLLEAADEDERRLLCSDVLSVLKRLFASSWGDRLEHILRHAILTLLSASQTSYGSNGSGTSNGRTYTERTYTLRDIRPLLSNKAFRERVIHDLDDLELKAFWTGEFVSYSSSHFAPLYNKLGLLLSSPLVRNIIAQKQSKLSYTEVMQNRQILIVNLASSRIGNDNAHFLGALLVSKLQIAAMQSLRLGQAQRTPFTLYVDEFQNFVVSSFETILSEAGKAGLSLMMANQFLEQLNGNLQTAILGNVGTLCSFRVSSDSGRLLEKEMAGCFKSGDLVSLNRGEAVARIGSARDSFLIETLPPPPMPSTSPAAMIRDQSRAGVCRPRGEVEVELSEEAARQAALEYEEEQAALAAKAREKEREAERKRLDEERKQAVRDDEVRRKQEEKQAEADRKRRETERKRQEAERLRQERRQEEENQRQAQKPGGHQARQDNRQSVTPKPVAMPQPVQKSQLVQKPIAAETRPDAGDGAKHSSTDRATGLEEPFELGARVPPQDEKTPPVPVEPECFGVPDEP